MTRPDTTPDAPGPGTDRAVLPCPFCGGPGMVFRTTEACCADAVCAGWTVNRCSIAAWNRRAPTPPVSVREAAAVPEVAALIRAASIARNDMIATRGPFWAEQHYGELLEALHPFNALATPPTDPARGDR